MSITKDILQNVLTKKCQYCYFIESQYQRPFVWTLSIILNDFINVVYAFLLRRKEDEYYEYKFGTIGTSYIEEVNKKYINPVEFSDYVKSILDGGHRIRLFMCLYITLLVLKYRKENKEYLNLDDFIKVKNGEYKLDGIGSLKDDFKGFYSFINKTKINDILKTKNKEFKPERIKKLFNKESDCCEKSMKEVFYFILYSLQGLYSDEGIDSLPEEVDYDFSIDAILNGITLYNESVPYDEKWYYFKNRNGRGISVADKYLYSRQLINTVQNDALREKVNSLFIEFDKKCKTLEKEKEYLKEYKDLVTFIMSEVFKLVLYENNIVKYTDKKLNIFSDAKIGLNISQCKHKILNDGKDIEKYFVLCNEYADFLSNPLGNCDSYLHKTNYLFYDFSRKTNVVIWSLIATSVFLMRKYYSDGENEKTIFDYVLHLMLFYYLSTYLLPGHNVSWFHNEISKFNKILFSMRNCDFEKTNNELYKIVNYNFGGTDKSQFIQQLTSSCKFLQKLTPDSNGKYKDGRGGYPTAIKLITLYFEACVVDIVGIKANRGLRDYFVKICNEGRNIFDIDHIFPKIKYNEELEKANDINFIKDSDNSKIGNFVMLENGLNRSKGDDENKNYVYTQSTFYTTSLINSNNKSDLTNEQISKLPFKRYNEEILNNPTLSFIDNRSNEIAYTFVNWVYSVIEKYKPIKLENVETSFTTEVVYSA